MTSKMKHYNSSKTITKKISMVQMENFLNQNNK